MKKTDEKMNLDQLLSVVEKAGRNSRRREALSQMIDELAAEETSKHRRLLWYRWSVGISIAACIALFVNTLVKANFVPERVEFLTAEVKNSEIKKRVSMSETKEMPPCSSRDTKTLSTRLTTSVQTEEFQSNHVEETEEKTTVSSETESSVTIISDRTEVVFADAVLEEPQYDNAVEEAPELSVAVNEDLSQLNTDTSPMKEATKDIPAKARRWFQLRRAEPSKMNGTMLAVRIL